MPEVEDGILYTRDVNAQASASTALYDSVYRRRPVSTPPPVGLNANGRYSCWTRSCEREFDTPEQLLEHQFESNHLDYMCCVCDKVFSRKDILRRHIKSLHLKEVFVCQQCADHRTFNRQDHFRKHQLQAHGMVLCPTCGAGFTETKALTAHVVNEHSAPSPSSQ